MKGLSAHLLLLCLYSASKLARGSSSIGKRSNVGHLITKSGKTFLQVSGKKTRITKDTRKESSNDNSIDGNANEEATGMKEAKVEVTGKRGINKQLPNYGQ